MMKIALLAGFSLFNLLLAHPAEAQFFEKVNGFTGIASRSVAFGDYDNDGWPDQFLAAQFAGHIRLLKNLSGTRFVNRTPSIASAISTKWKGGGAIWGDYDNDGDLDIFVPTGSINYEQRDRNALLRNDRGTFRDVYLAAGLTDSLPTDNAIWLDYDRDGFIDLYTGNVGAPDSRNLLYRNQGDGTFRDVTEEAGLLIQLHPEGGGSNGGMAAADFNDDGWPDLYIALWLEPNRLFLNDGQGRFRDATSSEISTDIADPGQALGVSLADIDNDLQMDILLAAGGNATKAQRSQVLLNRGEGRFVDVTDQLGLGSFTATNAIFGINTADVDNDGDIDIMTGFEKSRFFINQGDGLFVDRSEQSGLIDRTFSFSLGDYNLDGALDLLGGGDTGAFLHRNTGNDHHWLRVELVGVESNRSAIGARLIARAGETQQLREILGGLGFYQNELVAHFGLGDLTQVDQLEIRWPSGQVDVLTDIPADQKIRVIEGRGTYYTAEPSIWITAPPDTFIANQNTQLELAVRPALFEADATIAAVTANLSQIGGPREVPMQAMGDGTYQLTRSMQVHSESTSAYIDILIEQDTSLGPHWIRLGHQQVILLNAPTAVLESHTDAQPSIFALAQNYPNPFNSTTVIRFALPQDSAVELAVYNLAGQRVATLVDGLRQAGSHAVHWNGDDDLSRELGSGIYLYQLRIGERQKTRKLLLLR